MLECLRFARRPASLRDEGVLDRVLERLPRKLMPALYTLWTEGYLTDRVPIIGVARRDKSDDEFRNEIGEARFTCKEGNIPRGLLFVPYGPPTCELMGGRTDGTGMPDSKGWDVEVELIP